MGAAGNIQQQAVRRVEPDERRIAVAPVGDFFEERTVGRRVGGRDAERGKRAARVGEACAEADAAPLGGAVDGDDAQRIGDLLDDRQRLVRRRA